MEHRRVQVSDDAARSFSAKLSKFRESLESEEQVILDSIMFVPAQAEIGKTLRIDLSGGEVRREDVATLHLREDQAPFQIQYGGKVFEVVACW